MHKIVFLILGFFVFSSFAEAEVTAVKAPALVPSQAGKMRKAREEAEVATESAILEKIEAQRLRDEQKRIQGLTGGSAPAPEAVVAPSPALKQSAFSQSLWRFGEKAFFSLGVGTVQYPGVKNISSVRFPALFFSFGGYATSHLIVDFVLFQSQHFVEVRSSTHALEGVYQPGVSLSLKYSPLEGRVKPYIGASGSYKSSRWFRATRTGRHIRDLYVNVGQKRWYQAFDGGATTGVDVALGSRVGVNVDFRYHLNLYTETDRVSRIRQPLDQRDSFVFSTNLRFYFH